MSKQDQYTNWVEGGSATSKVTRALDQAYSAGPSMAVAQRAQSALRQALAAETGPVIYYDLLEETPLGPIWVAVGPQGLVATAYDGSEENVRSYLQRHIGGLPQRSAGKVAKVKEQVRSYLLGRRDRWELNVDLSAAPPFQRRVLEEIRKVPRGQVSTYAEIARRIGAPKAARAVGQALRNNPMPIVVPCHRIIASDGSLGGYSGRLRDRRKIELLKLEGVALA